MKSKKLTIVTLASLFALGACHPALIVPVAMVGALAGAAGTHALYQNYSAYSDKKKHCEAVIDNAFNVTKDTNANIDNIAWLKNNRKHVYDADAQTSAALAVIHDCSKNLPNGVSSKEYFPKLSAKLKKIMPILWEEDKKDEIKKEQDEKNAAQEFEKKINRSIKRDGYSGYLADSGMITLMQDISSGNISEKDALNKVVPYGWHDDYYYVSQVISENEAMLATTATLYRFRENPVVLFRKNKYMKGSFVNGQTIKGFNGTGYLVYRGTEQYITVFGAPAQAFVFEFANIQ